MPVMDGFAATPRIRQHGLNLHTYCAVTVNAMPSDKARCLECGMNGYTAKPIQRNELYELIKNWVTVASASANYAEQIFLTVDFIASFCTFSGLVVFVLN